MEKIIPNGTEVLIFKYVREWGPNQDDENYIVGTVQSSETSDNLSTHGSAYYVQIYEVLGQDGKKYVGTYGTGFIGNSFFRTKEDHIKNLKRKISHNKEDILKLQEKNKEYSEQINLLKKGAKCQEYDVSVVSCDREFVVSPEKADEFKNLKPNSVVRQQMEETLDKLRINNLVKEGPALVKKKIK